MRTTPLAALACAVMLAGCGAGSDDAATTATTESTAAPSASAAPTTTIRIKDFEFDPTPATIKAGEKIAVPNADDAPHTLTDEPTTGKPQFDTGTVQGKRSGTFTATKPGTYKVYCEIHPFMKGEVTVVQ